MRTFQGVAVAVPVAAALFVSGYVGVAAGTLSSTDVQTVVGGATTTTSSQMALFECTALGSGYFICSDHNGDWWIIKGGA